VGYSHTHRHSLPESTGENGPNLRGGYGSPTGSEEITDVVAVVFSGI